MSARRTPLHLRRSLVLCAAQFVLALFATSCGGSLFKVKPVIELPPLTGEVKSGSAGGVTIKVAPLLSDEESQDLFEANLPLSGVLPLRVELEHESGVPVELKRARFRMHDSSGKEWKLLSTKQAISQILKANGVFAYNPNSRKQFEKEFAEYALDVKSPLSMADRRRQGFLFFQTPNKEPVASPRGLVLQVERVPQPVEIKLN
ncbi:MAG TPA: hypothetical protein VJM12_03740 [Pyrinomonadaceae bacterium]|nr:hypothetical protein [Pyrinomonadaceae bacterium]